MLFFLLLLVTIEVVHPNMLIDLSLLPCYQLIALLGVSVVELLAVLVPRLTGRLKLSSKLD